MKIAIIVRKLNVKGGVQRHVIEFARQLVSSGQAVTLYTYHYSPKDCYEDLLAPLRVVALDSIPQTAIFSGFFGTYGAAKNLAMLIDRDTELLNPHDHGSYRVAYYFKTCVRNAASVWMMHDMPTKMFSYMRARRLNPNFSQPLWKIILYRIFDWYDTNRFIKAQDAITVLDRRDQEWVRTYFKIEATIVRNGISLEMFPFSEHPRPNGKQLHVLMVGIFLRHRRYEDAIRAIDIVRKKGYDVRMTIVGEKKGDRAYADEIQAYIADAGIGDAITMQGCVSEEELARAYHTHEVFISPNHLQSWGLAVFEAMACGCPVIVSMSAGASEVLTNEQNALLVPPKDPQAIAQAIETLITNPDLYQKLSTQGRIFVEQNISWKRYARDMLKVFKGAILKQRAS